MNRTKQPVERVSRLKTLARTLLKELELAEEPEQIGESQWGVDFYEEVKRFEIKLITRALTRSRGHQLEAARFIRLKPSTLNAKIKQYGIQVNSFSRGVVSKLEEFDSPTPGRYRGV